MAQEAERQHPNRAEADSAGYQAIVAPGHLTAKLAVCVIAFGVVAAGLLSMRQSRLQAGHEVTAARLRIREHDERLLAIRAEIAGNVSPSAVRILLAAFGGIDALVPMAGKTKILPDAWLEATVDDIWSEPNIRDTDGISIQQPDPEAGAAVDPGLDEEAEFGR